VKLQNLISNIPALQSGGQATFNLPIGIRYHGFNLFLSSSGVRTAVSTTNFQRLRVIINSTTLIDWDWPSIQYYALRRGISLAVGQIPIYFADPLLKGQRNANCGTIDTKQGITNVQVYIQLGTITSPSMTGEIIFDNFLNTKPVIGANGQPTGATVGFNTPIMRLTQVENVPVSANYDIFDIAPSYPIDTITLYNGADANISQVTLLLNKVIIFQGIPADIAREFMAYGIQTPAGCIVFPFTYDGFSPNSAAAFSAIDIYVNCATAFPCGISVEYQLPSIT
jgi:Viral coat protein P2 N-terminal domain